MKLRIQKNSIRLRLKQGEVEKIVAGQIIGEQTCFPGSMLTYRLGVADGDNFSAKFDGGTMDIYVPAAEIAQWANSDQVSIFAELPAAGAEVLSILIEKDFKCLAPGDHRACEDDLDTYPHPNAASENGC